MTFEERCKNLGLTLRHYAWFFPSEEERQRHRADWEDLYRTAGTRSKKLPRTTTNTHFWWRGDHYVLLASKPVDATPRKRLLVYCPHPDCAKPFSVGHYFMHAPTHKE